MALIFSCLGMMSSPVIAADQEGNEGIEQTEPAESTVPERIGGTTYYTRSTEGDDANSGTSAEAAFKTIARAARELGPGDTLIIGPGTYRDSVKIERGGVPGSPVRILGDASGKQTGDPPGPVLLAGSVPVDESIFEPEGSPGVYKATIPDFIVYTVVEMDGPQYRYRNVREPVSDIPYVERVRRLPGSAWFVRETNTLYIHTADGKPPTDHEFELIRYHSAFHLTNKPHVWFGGFTMRHFIDGCIVFTESDHGRVFDTVAFGCRQGVRVRTSKQVQVLKNVMFRNENSGVYYLVESVGGLAQGNFMFENDVGIRFSSDSGAGLVLNNTLLENHDGGISIERVHSVVAAHNAMKDNLNQLRLWTPDYLSDYNCFELQSDSDQAIAKEDGWRFHKSLSDYSAIYGQDLNSMEGSCDIVVEKYDVQALHRQALVYPKSAEESMSSP